MPGSPSSEHIRTARQLFFEEGRDPRGLVPGAIVDSWKRCRSSGLVAARRRDPGPIERAAFEALRQQYEDLRRLCRPEIEALHADANATGGMVILAAPSGLVLDAIGSADFLDKAARVALRPGALWDEAHSGTNAIGTALRDRRATEVRGAEHYFGAHQVLSCSASPILDGRGRIMGVLDLSGDARSHHAWALGMVRFAVDQIERRLLERELTGREVIRLHRDAAMLGTHREGVLVFEDHRLVAANRYALDMLGADWDALGRCRYDALFADGAPQGARLQSLRGHDGARYQARRDLVASPLVRVPERKATAPASPREPVLVLDAATTAELDRGVRLLDADVPVLLQGETGTGKDVVARALHRRSTRSGGPFVALNCAAFPEGLIEAELFGYRGGAFTGARREGARGQLREADGGVLFLDEIGDMPLHLQGRLLRVLQDREVAPLGGGRAIRVDFAIVAATNRELESEVQAGRFRADLYYRIAQATLRLPAIRELASRGDLIARLWEGLGADRGDLAPDALATLADFAWPGNFRQLVGSLRALVALHEPGTVLTTDRLPPEIRRSRMTTAAAPTGSALREIADDAMHAALRASDGNVSHAARRLGVSRSTLYRRLGPERRR